MKLYDSYSVHLNQCYVSNKKPVRHFAFAAHPGGSQEIGGYDKMMKGPHILSRLRHVAATIVYILTQSGILWRRLVLTLLDRPFPKVPIFALTTSPTGWEVYRTTRERWIHVRSGKGKWSTNWPQSRVVPFTWGRHGGYPLIEGSSTLLIENVESHSQFCIFFLVGFVVWSRLLMDRTLPRMNQQTHMDSFIFLRFGH